MDTQGGLLGNNEAAHMRRRVVGSLSGQESVYEKQASALDRVQKSQAPLGLKSDCDYISS